MKSEREPLNFSIIKNKTKMKNLLLVTALMLSVVSYGQWKTLEYTDDFGDPTGETFQMFQCKGLFSNSATTNSDCGFLVKHDIGSPSYSVIIFPYNRTNRESFIKGTFQDIKLKTPSGIKELSAFVSKGGVVYFSNEDYFSFDNAISDPGDYIFLLNYVSSYTESKYSFKFTIN